MSREVINVGAFNNDPTADSIRTGGTKANDNFAQLFAGSSTYAISITDPAYGADPTGVSDSYAAVQAAITAGFAAGINVYAPPGVYKLSAMPVIGAVYSAPSIRSGWKFYGVGAGGNGIGGTVFRFTGTGANAILQVDGGTAWRNISLENFTLLFASGASATYGLLFSSTEFSQASVRRVKVDCETSVHAKAFGILTGTGVNGEFTTFEKCQAFNVDGFYYTDAGQAFCPYFENCYGLLNAGGIHFNLDIGANAVPGGGLTSTNYNGGANASGGISNSIFLRNNQNTSAVSFQGGRVEHVTAIYLNAEYTTGGFAGRTPNTTFNDMEFTCDYDAGNGSLTLPAAVVVAGGDTVRFNCQFERDTAGATSNITFPINTYGNGGGFWGDVEFNSTWSGFLRGPEIVAYGGGGGNAIRIEGRQPLITSTLGDRQITQRFSKFIESQEPHGRSIRNDNLLTQIGAPENRIVNCQIANTNGAGVTPLSPWAMTGGTTIGIQDWNGSPQPRSCGQFSRLVTLAAGATLYQDIAALDLSSGSTAHYSLNGRACSFVSWTLKINELGGSTTVEFDLVDSVSGQVYDKQTYQTTGSFVFLRSVELMATIAQTGVVSYPRIKISNTGANPLTLDLAEQSVGSTWNPAFGAFKTSTALTQDYTVADRLMLSGLLNLAILPDAYGLSASNAIPNNEGSIYKSGTTDLITWAGATRDWQLPQTLYGSAAPLSGAWLQNQIILNNNVAEAGAGGSKYVVLGWICTVAGSPGTWLPMRTLTGN